MKPLRVALIPALLVLCVGMACGQDVAQDVDKGATKTGHFVKHAGKKVGHATKSGVNDAGHGTKVVAKTPRRGSRRRRRRQEKGSRTQPANKRLRSQAR
jgi:hypothetical protein